MSQSIAQDRCANYCNGICTGVMIHDNLTMTRFKPENTPCVLKAKTETCKYFNQIVLRGIPKPTK